MSLIENIPFQYRNGSEAAAAAISKFDKTLIAAHVNLDGDALGSICACGFILKKLGKEFVLYSSSGIPHYLDFLDLPGKVYNTLQSLPFTPESAIFLDCNDVARLGHELAQHARDWPSVNIDHHIGGRGLASLVNFIDKDAAAASQLVAYLAMSLDFSLSGKMANAIALGLMTDTGGFCHGNTTGDIFSLCALLVNNGCDFSYIRENLQNSWTLDRIHLWGDLLQKVLLYFDKRIAFCYVSLDEMQKHHCLVEDLEGLVDQFRKIHKVEVAVLLREDKSGFQKFSLRSYGKVDVRAMAAIFGGGGHQNAAGGMIESSPDEAKILLLEVIRQHLEKMYDSINQ